jgi:putative DNA primase/helicase
MSFPHQDPVDEVLRALEAGGFAPRPAGENQWLSRCPVHGGKKSNLAISRASDGRVLLFCHHSSRCGFREILGALNLAATGSFANGRLDGPRDIPTPARKPKKIHQSAERAIRALKYRFRTNGDTDWKPDAIEIAGRWLYLDEEGQARIIVVRFRLPDGTKSYGQVSAVEGGWITGMVPGPRLLYRLPEVLDADRVFIVEGEKTADAVAGLGLVSTTTPGGSQGAGKADLSPLRGRNVVILPDNDPAGHEYASRLSDLLRDIGAASVRVVELPGLPAKGDAVDWLRDVVPDNWGPEQCRAELERLAVQPTDPTADQHLAEAQAQILEEDEAVDDPSLDAVLAGCNRTDLGNAERLIARHRRDIRHCASWGKWMVWDGKRWVVDEDDEVRRRAKATVRAMLAEAGTIADDRDRKAHADFAFASENHARLTAMIYEARSEPGIPVKHQDLDTDPWLLNCPNGTLDLRTGTIRPHRRSDLITRICPVEYHPDAKCPLWESTLDLFFSGDQELISYWQKLCGYFLAGVVRDHILPVCFGVGSNGKSTMLETQMAVMGEDYAMKAPGGFLMSKHQESHPCDKADLFGKRLVVAIETKEGRRLDESLIKELTGGDTVRARRMRENFWQFKPTHKVVLATNHRPTVRGTDNGIWRRLRLVPFAVKVEGAKADTLMGEKLKAEHPGILAWSVRGCLAWQRDGIIEPTCVAEATEAYRSEQDVFAAFLEECTIQEPSVRTRSTDLYDAYRTWAERSGERPMNKKTFGQTMRDRGFDIVKNNTNWYCGIGVRDVPADDRTGAFDSSKRRSLPVVA